MSQPVVLVESVAFRDVVLPLRLDDGRVVAGTPQWVAGERSHPVAIVASRLDRSLRLSVGIRSTDAAVAAADIRALPVLGPARGTRRGDADTPLLSGVTPSRVVFDATGLAEIDCAIEVRTSGVEVDVVSWRWQYRPASSEQWIDTTVTEHEVAVTLDEPGPPWTTGDEAGGLTHPWWDVVKKAGQVAASITTVDDLATRVTEAFFHRQLGRDCRWDAAATDHYTSPIMGSTPFFDCASWLRFLRGEVQPSLIDCSDAAAVVVTFTNVLGGRHKQYAILMAATTRPIRMVGPRRPWERLDFGLHQFAVNDVAAGQERVWDGALEMSTDPPLEIRAEPQTFQVAADRDQREYQIRLWGRPTPLADHRAADEAFRPLRPAPGVVKPVRQLTDFLQQVADRYDFRRWAGPPERPVDLRPPGRVVVPGWDTLPGTGAPSDGPPPADDRERVGRFLFNAAGAPERLVALESYDCRDRDAARLRLVALLARMHGVEVERVELGPDREGDVEFAAPAGADGAVIAGIRGRVCVVARRATPEVTQEQVREIYDAYLGQLR